MKHPNKVIAALAGTWMLTISVAADSSARVSRWVAVESWHDRGLVYAFHADGTFQSGDVAPDGKAGLWAIDGNDFAMFWPAAGEAVFRGRIQGNEIRGIAYARDGGWLGDMVLRWLGGTPLMPASGSE